MSVLWAGGEDFDFPISAVFPTADTTGGTFRAGFARYGMYNGVAGQTNVSKSEPFGTGSITSGWVTARIFHTSPNSSFDMPFGQLLLGLVKSTTAASGIWLAISSTDQQKLAICTFDGTTVVQLVAESGQSFVRGNLFRYDMQVVNYGATGTVTVYVNGASIPIMTFTGNIAVTGVTNLDTVAFSGNNPISFSPHANCSEFIVADEDTRGFSGVVTMAPSAAGTTDQWAGAFTDVNELVVNDTTTISTNVVGQDEQFNLLDMPAGNFLIKAVVVAARSSAGGGAVPTKIALGFNSGGTVAVGTAQPVSTAWIRLNQVFAQNPVTSANWLLSDMNALQLDLRSST